MDYVNNGPQKAVTGDIYPSNNNLFYYSQTTGIPMQSNSNEDYLALNHGSNFSLASANTITGYNTDNQLASSSTVPCQDSLYRHQNQIFLSSSYSHHNTVLPQYPISTIPNCINNTYESAPLQSMKSSADKSIQNPHDQYYIKNDLTNSLRPKNKCKTQSSLKKSHVDLEDLIALIEKVDDIDKITSASRIVKEIIRVLPLQRNATISHTDKETVLHAVDEIAHFFEAHIRTQLRRTVLKYGFQAISSSFVPDTNTTRCEIGEDNEKRHCVGNRIDKGVIGMQRLCDGEYYSCWMNKNYSKRICMQQLSVATTSRKGDPTSFNGFTPGKFRLEADMETALIIQSNNKHTLFHWLHNSIGYKVPKKNYHKTIKSGPDYLIMKVTLKKPHSESVRIPKTLCELEFWEFNGTRSEHPRNSKHSAGSNRITALLAEGHPLQPLVYNQDKSFTLDGVVFDHD